MKHFFFIIMLLLNFSNFFAQKNNHDCMQGVWDGGIHCEKYPIYCNQEFVLIHDDEILRMIFNRFEHWSYQKGGWKLLSIQEYGEGKMWVEKSQFLLIKDKYMGALSVECDSEHRYEKFPDDFVREEVEDINSNVYALFRRDSSELDLRGNRISGYKRPTIDSLKCFNDSLYVYYAYRQDLTRVKRDLKLIDNDSLPSYLSDGIFNYSLTSKRDYYQEFFGKTVGVIKENDSDDDQASKKRRVFIIDENESSYYVKPLGSSEVKEGWVNKKDVRLLRIMIID
jgi:hypothetical protein